MQLPLPIHSYQHRARQVASRRLVNCYAEQSPLMAKSPVTLLRAPGVTLWTTLPSSPIRGFAVHDKTLYVVAGTRLYSVDSAGSYTDRGEIPGSGHTPMASNGPELVIVNPPNAYVWNGTLAQIADEDFVSRGAETCAFVDGFILFVEPNSGRFFGSGLINATAYDALDFATAESALDDLLAIAVEHRQVFLFGQDTVEVWYNQGGAGFPFAREQNGLIEAGCGAARSVAKGDNTIFWLDNTRIARRLSDLTPARISTHAVEQAWQSYTTVSDAFAFTFAHEGHFFYCLTFPTAHATWVFDVATGEWHERSSRDLDDNDAEWRVSECILAYGYNIVGDARSGAIGKIDASAYFDFDTLQRMEWTYPSVYANGRRAFHRRLEIGFEAGVGDASSDPQAMLSVSDDGGKTFAALPNRSIGKVGEYRHRVVWTRLGSSSDRVYRAAVSDPAVVAVADTQLEVEGGRL